MLVDLCVCVTTVPEQDLTTFLRIADSNKDCPEFSIVIQNLFNSSINYIIDCFT